jgi:hypothetical protein
MIYVKKNYIVIFILKVVHPIYYVSESVTLFNVAFPLLNFNNMPLGYMMTKQNKTKIHERERDKHSLLKKRNRDNPISKKSWVILIPIKISSHPYL